MNVQQRIELLVKAGEYMLGSEASWLEAQQRAYVHNPWFLPQFIELAAHHIARTFLQPGALQQLATQYQVPPQQATPKTVGIVMAGNIPLVGFHDFLCTFLSGHHQKIKTSQKDEILLKHLVEKMTGWNSGVSGLVTFAEMLKNCDAYIATGSNNTGRYFDYYFARYPHIIRKNRTSVAVLTGSETKEELALLARDVQLYFGLGCRNVTHLKVPEGYRFEPLLEALDAFDFFMDHHKYKNNYEYQLALLIMGNKYYMTNRSVVLTEGDSLFAPVAQVNYSFYQHRHEAIDYLQHHDDVQCLVGQGLTPFGTAQQPCLTTYADGVDTMDFLRKL